MIDEMQRSASSWGRRAAAVSAVVTTAALLAPTPVPAVSTEPDPADRPALRLAGAGDGVRALDVALSASEQTVEATSFSMVGVTWRGIQLWT